MFEKLKAFGESAKTLVMCVIGPLLFVAAVVFAALRRKDSQIAELERQNSSLGIQNTLDKKEEAKADADSKDRIYQSMLDRYRRKRGPGKE